MKKNLKEKREEFIPQYLFLYEEITYLQPQTSISLEENRGIIIIDLKNDQE